MPKGVYARQPFSDEHRANMSASATGRASVPLGSTRINNGYVMLKVEQPDVWLPEHRVIAAMRWGEAAIKDKVVHHRNEDKTDNRLENLQVVTRDEHLLIHAQLRVNRLPTDHGLEAVVDYLSKTCTIDGCDLRTTRRGQPCNLCSKELGVGG